MIFTLLIFFFAGQAQLAAATAPARALDKTSPGVADDKSQTPVRVEASAPHEIRLVFRSVRQEPLGVVFAVEPTAPFRLISVKARE